MKTRIVASIILISPIIIWVIIPIMNTNEKIGLFLLGTIIGSIILCMIMASTEQKT